jgi:hypothetical protein
VPEDIVFVMRCHACGTRDLSSTVIILEQITNMEYFSPVPINNRTFILLKLRKLYYQYIKLF